MTKKGIVDPWRIVDPIKPPPRQAVDLAHVDMDDDLRVPLQHTFRCRTGGIQVKSTRMETEEDALRVLLACLFEILESPNGPPRFESSGIGFTLESREWNMPGPKVPSSYLGSGRVCIAFHRQTFEQGMRSLVRVIGITKRLLGRMGINILKKHGISPILR
jgi:hypothetical protein